jgi:hypothetical protein
MPRSSMNRERTMSGLGDVSHIFMGLKKLTQWRSSAYASTSQCGTGLACEDPEVLVLGVAVPYLN